MSSDDEFVIVDSGSEITEHVSDTVDSLSEAVESVPEKVDTTIAELDEKVQDSNERTYEEFVHDLTPIKTYKVNGVNYLLHNSVPNDTVKSMIREHAQCVECVSRVAKFSRLFGPVAKGSVENGSVFLRNIRCKTDGGCPDGCLFNVRKEIEKMNILYASLLAMKRAIKKLKKKPMLVLIDGNKLPEIKDYKLKSIIKGDQKVPSISAASIIAKVTRDLIMYDYDKVFPGYGFKNHKGYGTKFHIEAIKSKLFLRSLYPKIA